MSNPDSENNYEPLSEQIEDNLLNYCKTGNYKQVVYIFDKYYEHPGFDINCRDYEHNTALILAARQGHGSIIQELLRYTPDITLENKKGQTVIHLSTNVIRKIIFGSVSSCLKYSDRLFCNACWLGNDEVVERSLVKEQGRIRPDLTNLDGVSCYQLTLKNMNLLESIAVQIKVAYKPAQVLQSLLTHSPQPHFGDHLMHAAATKICKVAVEVTRVLLKKNFEITDKDEFDFTPIHHAARSGNAAVLDLLLSRSSGGKSSRSAAVVDCQGRAGNTPLHLAATEGREECVRILLNHGASIEVLNSSNYTPVQVAKSVRIKNLFLSLYSTSKEKLLPDIHFVMSRANTAIPPTPKAKPYSSGKKSAEPEYENREKATTSVSEFEEKFEEPSRKFTKSLAISTASNDFLLKAKLSRSVTLGCLNEETPTPHEETINEVINEDLEQDEHSNEVFVEDVQEKKLQIFEPLISKGPTLPKKRAPFSAKSPPKSRSPQNVDKTTRKIAATYREKPRVVNNVGDQKKKVVRKTRKGPRLQGNYFRNQKESEEAYESDFNSDSSSGNHGRARRRAEGKYDDSDSDDDSDAITEKLSARTSEHIKWRKGEQLGKGSYGTVWKGMLEDGQYIAVKEIVVHEEDEIAETPINNNVREIRREIEILRTIRHKNIVKYLGACDSPTCIHIFMEFVSGGSIAFILLKFGGFSEKIIRIYSRQIVTAVAFLHERSIIHRDLKGANVMVTPKGVIKVVDFGCAKRLESFSTNSRSLSFQSRLQGSVYWLAPEVINGSIHCHKSDIWSIGCIIIEMITTKPPWSHLHPYAAMFAIGSGRRPYLSLSDYDCSSDDKLSQEICEFVDLCLTGDVSCRSTASDLLMSAFLK